MRRPQVAAAAAALAGLFAGCAHEVERGHPSIFDRPVTLATSRPEYQLTQEVRRYRYPDLENPDGTVTRVLWVEPGQADRLIALLKEQPAFLALKRVDRHPSFFTDPLAPVGAPNAPPVPTNEALMLLGTKDQVDAATDLVSYVLTSPPLIEIEARIVEVKESDEAGFGIDIFALDRNHHGFDPLNPDASLSPGNGLFDRARIRPGLPPLPGTVGSMSTGSSLIDLGVIADGVQLDFLIRALKIFNKADVLSAPRVAVIDGFKSTFKAGEEIPIFEQTAFANVLTVTTKFKPIGIELTVVPRLISRDVIRMAVRAKVENVTGNATVTNGGVTVINPITSVREANTFVDVHDGAAVVIGGLLTTQKIQYQDRVPILGEIPVLDLLFSSTRSLDSRSNLLFFIRPRVISPSGDAGGSVITPAPESRPADR